MPEQAQTCLMTQSNTLRYMGSLEVPPEVPDLVMLVFMGQLSRGAGCKGMQAE
jgi:hypothetical protein